ncbi:helix-turn-helix domain-containing protein [Paenibacillus solisilvae]|uniref:Helix-turn-helix domain-containing protein n=1 Tax=Paenibacillus solisilvae TaxID=2486751 RepID=A0ABW0VVV6_9BACL
MAAKQSLFNPHWLNGEYRPDIIAYYYKQWNDFQMGFHTHETNEIMYVISGVCRVDTEDQSIAMRKGDLILLNSGVTHRLIVAEGPCRMLNVEFIFTACGSILPSMKQLAESNGVLKELLQREYSYIVMRDPSDVYHTLKSLVMELDNGGTNNVSMTHLLVSQLIVRVARLAAEEAKDSAVRQIDSYVRRAMEYMHQHYDCDIQAKDIAAAVNLHPVYLQRIFKSNMNLTLTEYLAEIRVEKAKMLLARTDVPIIEIADYVGLNSRQYFSALFKKHTGYSPAAYRKSVETFTGFN